MSLDNPQNVLTATTREELREWYINNACKESECWIEVKRGKPVQGNRISYIDAVEEALCFGWIDSTFKKIDGITMQRFSPRRKGSPWTELNKERVRRLEKLGLMTESGKAVLPEMSVRSFKIDADIEKALKEARVYSKFKQFPPLYQRVRAYNIAFHKKKNPETFNRMLDKLITETKKGNMYGEWNDFGRLL